MNKLVLCVQFICSCVQSLCTRLRFSYHQCKLKCFSGSHYTVSSSALQAAVDAVVDRAQTPKLFEAQLDRAADRLRLKPLRKFYARAAAVQRKQPLLQNRRASLRKEQEECQRVLRQDPEGVHSARQPLELFYPLVAAVAAVVDLPFTTSAFQSAGQSLPETILLTLGIVMLIPLGGHFLGEAWRASGHKSGPPTETGADAAAAPHLLFGKRLTGLLAALLGGLTVMRAVYIAQVFADGAPLVTALAITFGQAGLLLVCTYISFLHAEPTAVVRRREARRLRKARRRLRRLNKRLDKVDAALKLSAATVAQLWAEAEVDIKQFEIIAEELKAAYHLELRRRLALYGLTDSFPYFNSKPLVLPRPPLSAPTQTSEQQTPAAAPAPESQAEQPAASAANGHGLNGFQRFRAWFTTLLCCWLLTGCGVQQPVESALFVVLQDGSSSFTEGRSGLPEPIRKFVAEVPYGARVIVTDISDAPLNNGMAVNKVLPECGPTANNLVCQKARTELAQEIGQFITRTREKPAHGSCVIASLQKAQRAFEQYSTASRRVLLIHSDMNENCEQIPQHSAQNKAFSARLKRAGRLPDLKGATVVVAGAEAPGASGRQGAVDYQTLKTFWLSFVQECNGRLADYGPDLLNLP